MKPRLFYGWVIVAVAWVIYGFGISPAYYSWGIFAPEVIEELGLDRAQTGMVFGLFTFLYSGIGPITGIGLSRWGARSVMTVGSLIAAFGFFQLRNADSLLECLIYYGVLGGIGIGLSTILPCQTLATNWFKKRQATAVALIFIAGGIVGKGVTRFDAWMLENYSWRDGWMVIAGVSLFLSILAFTAIRNAPEDMGLHPDGIDPAATPDSGPTANLPKSPSWTAAAALRTPQFALLCLTGIGYAVPWGVVVAHGRLHLQDIGFSTSTAASILGTMVLISILGRLSGSLGDILPAQKVLGVALLVEGAGTLGLLFATSEIAASAATIAVGLGFGAAYIAITVVFANFFGRQAFAGTSGVRLLVTGTFNAIGPWFAGYIFDTFGSYMIAFTTIGLISLVGAIAALTIKAPVPASQAVII